MSYFLSIDFKKSKLIVNCHSTLHYLNELFSFCLNFINVMHCIFI